MRNTGTLLQERRLRIEFCEIPASGSFAFGYRSDRSAVLEVGYQHRIADDETTVDPALAICNDANRHSCDSKNAATPTRTFQSQFVRGAVSPQRAAVSVD